MLEMKISLVAPWSQRYATWWRMAVTGHHWGWLVRPCPINSPLTLFPFFVNSRLSKSAWVRMLLGEFAVLYVCCPMKNQTSLRRKGWRELSVPPLQYYLVQRSKKKATQVRSLVEIFLGVVPWASVSKAWMTLTGRGLTHFVGESSL